MTTRDHTNEGADVNTRRPVCVHVEGVQPRHEPATTPELDGLRARVVAVVEALGADELRVVLFVAERVRAGREVYGALDVANDGRDFRRERDEELADTIVYSACEALRRDLEVDPR